MVMAIYCPNSNSRSFYLIKEQQDDDDGDNEVDDEERDILRESK